MQDHLRVRIWKPQYTPVSNAECNTSLLLWWILLEIVQMMNLFVWKGFLTISLEAWSWFIHAAVTHPQCSSLQTSNLPCAGTKSCIYTQNRIFTRHVSQEVSKSFLLLRQKLNRSVSADSRMFDTLSFSLLDSARLPTDREGKLDYNRLAAVTTTGCKMIQLGGWDSKTDWEATFLEICIVLSKVLQDLLFYLISRLLEEGTWFCEKVSFSNWKY